MKTLNLILGFIILLNFISKSQPSYHYSYNYSAVCEFTDNPVQSQTSVIIQNDSIIIKGVYYNQCCPQFALRISEVTNDTLYVNFYDTATILCDCMCYYDININAGKYHSSITTVNFNGVCCNITSNEYQSLIQVGKKWYSLRTIPGLDYSLPTLIEYTIESDETQPFCWNGKFYYEVKARYIYSLHFENASDTVSRYIREENGKVFMVDQNINENNSCEEVLIYDFSLEVGDTVTLGFDSIKYVVVPINISEIQGRRCIALADLSEPEMSGYTIWIEGVGDLRGLFKSTESLNLVGTMNVLTCCSLNDTMIYQNEEYPDCGLKPPYQFFIQEGKTWITIVNCFIDSDTSYKSEVAISESNMNYNVYAMRFYPDTNFKDYYYHEANGKVFYNQEDDRFLIYDFAINPGDSIKVGNPNESEFNLFVDSVNYLKYEDDNLRKTLYLSGDMNTTWIEGIGDINSPLEYWKPILPGGCVPNFACCLLNDKLIYQDPQYPNCGDTISSISNKMNNQIRIYPNPSYGFIEFQGITDKDDLNYFIFNTLGQIELQGKVSSTLGLNLNEGFYLLIIKNGYKVYRTEKLIIK
ncbi:T9SS type A sorting domain-containing protein [Bacteroidota bacterium]